MSEKKTEKCPLCRQEMTDNAIANKAKIENLKELYKRYNDERDYHLKRFWENSIFIWTFLMVCFTAYGLLMNKFLDKNLHDDVSSIFPFLNSFICVIGFILSFFWYKMAKASKAWYEVFENAIWEMESLNNEFKYEDKYLIYNFWATKNGENVCSPSKIVIAIGAVLISFWVIALVFGIIVFNDKLKENTTTISILLTIIIIIVCFICQVFFLKSSTLRNENSQKVFSNIKEELTKLNIQYKYIEVKNPKKHAKSKIWLVLDKSYENNVNIINLKTKYVSMDYEVDILYTEKNDTTN